MATHKESNLSISNSINSYDEEHDKFIMNMNESFHHNAYEKFSNPMFSLKDNKPLVPTAVEFNRKCYVKNIISIDDIPYEANYKDFIDNGTVEVVELSDKIDHSVALKEILINSFVFIAVFVLINSFYFIDILILQSQYRSIDILNSITYTQLFMNILPLIINLGFSIGFNMLISKAYGLKNYDLIERLYYKAQMINLVLSVIFIAISFIVLPYIEDDLFINNSNKTFFSNYYPFALFKILLFPSFMITFRYLNVLGCNLFLFILSVSGCLFHISLSCILILALGYDTDGAGISLLVSLVIINLAAFVFVYFYKPNFKSNEKISLTQIFSGWIDFIKNTVYFLLNQCILIWGIELILLIALFGNTNDYSALAIFIICLNFIWIISFGLGSGLKNLLTQSLTKNYFNTSKVYINLYLYITLGLALVYFIIFVFAINIIAIALSENSSVQLLLNNQKIWLGIIIIFQAINESLKDLLACCGYQKEISIISIIISLIIQPIIAGVVGLLYEQYLVGYIISLLVGNVLYLLALGIIVYLLDMFNSFTRISLKLTEVEEGKKSN